MVERLVVIGGDAAGMSAASGARRLRPDLEIVVVEKGSWTSYSACGIPYVIAGQVDGWDDLVARTPQEFRDRQRIDVRMHTEAEGVDVDRREVVLRDHDHGRSYRLGFDQLLLATGARPLRPDVPGVDGPHVHGVQTLDDGAALLRDADERAVRHVVVVGGGYIGLEVAEAFTRRGARVVLVEGGPEIMRTLDADMAGRVRAAMGRMGIDVRVDTPVEAIEPGAVITAEGSLPADLVVLGTGVTPNSALLGDAGAELGARGSVRVDRRQRTTLDGIWAAGDCAESFHLVSQRPIHVALGTVANKQGRVAGVNLGGGSATFPGVVGTAITRVCELEVGRTGLTEVEAERAGFDHVAETITTTTRAGYYPGAAEVVVKMLAERGTGRLLGAQIVGGEGAAKRIDVVATALHAGFSATDLVDADLSYAPPFSGVWDPVQVAARVLASPRRTG